MSASDLVAKGLKALENPAVVVGLQQASNLFSNTKIGALFEGASLLAAGNATIKSVTGKDSVLDAARVALEKASPHFDKVVQACVGAVCKAPGQESGLQAAAAALKGHFDAGKELLQTGAKTAMAHVAGKGNKLG